MTIANSGCSSCPNNDRDKQDYGGQDRREQYPNKINNLNKKAINGKDFMRQVSNILLESITFISGDHLFNGILLFRITL